jgi:hypothetical protein
VLEDGVEIAGNFIGTDPCGLVDMGNREDGLFGLFVNGVQVGGSQPADRNLISANDKHGEELTTKSLSNRTEGNLIGTDRTGVRPLGNAEHGILLRDASEFRNMAIRNVIAYNGAAGVAVGRPEDLLRPPPSQLAILENHIHDNGGLGIDLNSDGVTQNDGDDPQTPEDDPDHDTGPNGFQNAPVLNTAVTGAMTSVSGSLESVPSTAFRIEFFSSPARDPSNFGEGANYLGFFNVTTNLSGDAPFALSLPAIADVGSFLTATATRLADQDFNPQTPPTPAETSEFSAAILVEAAPVELDFGDAPTAAQSGFVNSYPTRAADDGARHEVGAGLFLGAAVDPEVDGQPTANADGDGTDEDGVTLVASALASSAGTTRSSFVVTASLAGKLDAWIDFNRDGDWLDAAEQLFAVSLDVVAGANLVSYSIPANASPGPTYARFRLSSGGGLAPTGAAADGEVEDHPIVLLDADAGATVVVNMPPGQSDLVADGNDLVVRHAGVELFRAPASAIAGWDFRGSPQDDTLGLGSLSGVAGEPRPIAFDGGDGNDQVKLLASDQVLDLTTAGFSQLIQLEALDIVGNSPNQLILNVDRVLAVTGDSKTLRIQHDDDDTTDYGAGWQVPRPQIIDGVYVHVLRQAGAELRIVNLRAWQNPYVATDVNRDGTPAPIDVLNVVNTLNSQMARPLATPTTDAELPTFYFDTNGDRFVTPQDALVVINLLNRQGGGEGEASRSDSLLGYVLPSQSVPVLLPLGAEHRTRALDGIPARAEVERAWRREPVRSPNGPTRTIRECVGSGIRQDEEREREWENLLDVLAEDAAGESLGNPRP